MFDKDEPTSMTEEKIRSLESIGFKWARLTGEELWNQRYSDLVAFKKEVRYDIAAVPFHSFDVLIFICTCSCFAEWTLPRSHQVDRSSRAR